MIINHVELGDVCDVDSGAGFPLEFQEEIDGDYPFFKVGDMNSLGNEYEMNYHQFSIFESTRSKLKARIFPKGSIIFPKIGAAISTNKKRLLSRPSCVDNNVMVVIPKEKIDIYYLFYLFIKKNLDDFAESGNPPSIRKSTVQTWKIPLPPLDEQKRIAARLGKADRLRRLRRYALEVSEGYLQSLFLEMFGKDNNKFSQVFIEEVASNQRYSLSSGPFGSSLTSDDYVSEGVLVLRGLNISGESIVLNDTKFITKEKAQTLSRSYVKPDDVLIVAVGASGKACLVPNEINLAVMSQNFNKITPDKSKIHPIYLVSCINSRVVQSQFEREITDTVRTFLSLTKIKEIIIPLPPLELQYQYADIYKRCERLRAQQREALRQAEHLFQTLLHQAFDTN